MRIKLALAALALAAASPVLAADDAPPTPFEAEIGQAKGAMMAEPDKALVHANAAAAIAGKLASPRDRALSTAQAQWLQGEALTRIDRVDQARPVLASALDTVIKLDPRSKLHGDLLLSSSAIDAVTGQLPKALAELQDAYGIFSERGEARSEAKVLQHIGSIYFDARDYPRVLKYYAQSADVYKGDPALTISAYNNLGDTLKEMRRFKEAESHYQTALKVTREVESPLLEVRVLNNIASAEYLAGDLAKADATADRGLARAKGLDTADKAFLWGVKGQIALARHDYPLAKSYLDKTFQGADPKTTTLPFREFHESAYRLYSALGDDRAALVHLTAFKRLDDQAREVAASTNAALMGARFDFANQELRITKLKAGQLQRDIALERSRARLRSTILFSALGTALVVAIGTMLAFFSIRRSRNEVRAANLTLSDVNVELNKALTAKTRFLATTSHEIRTPLNGILGMTQVMLHDRALPDQQRDRVQIVHDAGTMMKALVDDILDVAKIETGNLTIEQAEFDLVPLLSGVARLWGDEAAAKGLAFTQSLADCPAKMVGDSRRLRQIIFNLMSNAVKFTNTGSVELSAAADGDTLVVKVADTGIGIPASELETVFESFHQVDGELTRQHGGTGLGLAICRELCHAMGGEIAVHSVVGEGSVFTVRLPLGCPVEAQVAGDDAWPEALGQAALLVVDGNALTRSILAASLAPSFARVRSAGADDAAASSTAERAHHIIADLGSLAAAGDPVPQVAALAASQGAAKACVTLLATEPPTGDAAEALARAGAAQILKRPIAVSDLVAALNRVHTGASSREAIAA